MMVAVDVNLTLAAGFVESEGEESGLARQGCYGHEMNDQKAN